MPSLAAILKFVALASAAAAATTSSAAARSPLIVADEEPFALAVNTSSRAATQTMIPASGATFMTVHFTEFNLADGDKVVVRDVQGRVKYEYVGLGRGQLGKSGGFFSSRIPGDQAIVEFLPAATGAAASGDFGYKVDKIARSSTTASGSTVCGTDDSKPAKCYAGDAALPQAYQKSQAVARLLVDGVEGCTGWLIGSSGHLLTNQHCISTDAKAAVTDFEFSAESSSCSEECQEWLGCSGKIVATSATLLAVNAAYDYALVKLNTVEDLSAYGHLTLRVAGASQDEQIYVPQYPGAWAKRIAAVDDTGSVTRVNKVGVTTACGEYSVGYTADTRGGSSGSPVIAASDNQVIALHNCGGLEAVCENGGIDIRTVLWDLKSKGVTLPSDAISDPTAEIPAGPWIPGTTKAPTPAPTPVPTASVCKIFRQQTSCENTLPGKRCIWVDGACVPNTSVAPPVTTPAPTPVAVEPTPEPTTLAPTPEPTPEPTTVLPTPEPTTLEPTPEPTTVAPTPEPTPEPITLLPTPEPTTLAPTTLAPTPEPTTVAPTPVPSFRAPAFSPSSTSTPVKTPQPTKPVTIPPQCKHWPKVLLSLCVKIFRPW